MALRKRIRQLRINQCITMGNSLSTAIRFRQGRWCPKTTPYTEPYEVIYRENEIVYMIHMNGRDVVLSTERLNPIFLPNAEEVPKLSQEESTENMWRTIHQENM